MSDAIAPVAPVTLYSTSFTGVLPTGAVGKGAIHKEAWQQTTYPNGSVVTRIYHNIIEVYDNRAVVTKHNQPSQIDMMV
jgi:hypothetical protein